MALELDRQAVISGGSFIQFDSSGAVNLIQGYVHPLEPQERVNALKGAGEHKTCSMDHCSDAHDDEMIAKALVQTAAG